MLRHINVLNLSFLKLKRIWNTVQNFSLLHVHRFQEYFPSWKFIHVTTAQGVVPPTAGEVMNLYVILLPLVIQGLALGCCEGKIESRNDDENKWTIERNRGPLSGSCNWIQDLFSTKSFNELNRFAPESHENKGNDHQLKKFLIFKQIILVSTL